MRKYWLSETPISTPPYCFEGHGAIDRVQSFKTIKLPSKPIWFSGSIMFPASTHVLGEIVLRTAVIYLVVLLGVRLSGKREVGQMTPFDLTLLLLISNSVQNAMTGPDTSLIGGVAAALTLLLMNYLIAELSGTNRRFRRIIQGQPTLLVHDGNVLTAHLAKEHVSMDELERALREHGVENYHQVALAVLEVDGSISCLKYDELSPAAHNHLVRRKYLEKH